MTTPPGHLEVEVRELRQVEGGDPLRLEQRDVRLLCRRITTIAGTSFYAPVRRSHPLDPDGTTAWEHAARWITRLAPASG